MVQSRTNSKVWLLVVLFLGRSRRVTNQYLTCGPGASWADDIAAFSEFLQHVQAILVSEAACLISAKAPLTKP